MAPSRQAMAMSIALQPVPLELTKVVSITCIDCEREDTNRRWHFLGVQCNYCSSFNTNIDETLMTGQDAVDFLGSDESDIERSRQAIATVMETEDRQYNNNDEVEDDNDN